MELTPRESSSLAVLFRDHPLPVFDNNSLLGKTNSFHNSESSEPYEIMILIESI
jgi:hypothetical protein